MSVPSDNSSVGSNIVVESTVSNFVPHLLQALKEENAQLNAELREAREKIRNLELQVESMKVNAKKAAALLDA